MSEPNQLADVARALVWRCAIEIPEDAHLEHRRLSGGLEASGVSLVTARYRDTRGRHRVSRYVFKELDGRGVREAAVYRHIAARHAGALSPRLVAVANSEPDHALLCLEAVRRTSAWPWRDLAVADKMLARLAAFHIDAGNAAPSLPEWDYEAEFEASAEATWSAVDRTRYDDDLKELSRDFPPLDRIAQSSSAMRRQLLSVKPFGSGPIHGDVHPGNALVRRRGGGHEPLLFDWGRARLGSPLEDVSSWLQTLGYWEYRAKQRHDSLLAGYLSSFGLEQKLTGDIRAAYWLAGASNALAGALLHHICIAEDRRLDPARRAASFRSARDWLRVVRRADAWWG